MRKQTVAFDIDGVLADFTSGFTALAAELGAVKEGWTGYEQPTFGFKFNVDKVWDAVNDKSRFWYDLDTLTTKAERELMHRMTADVNIVYVTARKQPAHAQTYMWLDRFGFPEGAVFFTDDKLPLYQSMSGGLRWAIDDKPETIEALHAAGLPIIVRHWPYNAESPGLHVPHIGHLMTAWADE